MAAVLMGPLRLLLFGAPGVGKGTQAAEMQERHGVQHISTGDMLRSAIRNGTPQGIQAKSIVERGELVPDALISEMIGTRLRQEDVQEGFVLDGFPRTVAQAEYLDTTLAAAGRSLDGVINIAVPAAEIEARLTGRWVCGTCGANYHVRFRQPRASGRCDVCGGALVQRQDDTLEVIRGRLRVYGAQTAPVLEHYRRLGLLIEVDGCGRPEDVAARIEAAVEARKG